MGSPSHAPGVGNEIIYRMRRLEHEQEDRLGVQNTSDLTAKATVRSVVPMLSNFTTVYIQPLDSSSR